MTVADALGPISLWVNQYDLSAHCHGIITSYLSVKVSSTAKTCIQKIIMIKLIKIIEGWKRRDLRATGKKVVEGTLFCFYISVEGKRVNILDR